MRLQSTSILLVGALAQCLLSWSTCGSSTHALPEADHRREDPAVTTVPRPPIPAEASNTTSQADPSTAAATTTNAVTSKLPPDTDTGSHFASFLFGSPKVVGTTDPRDGRTGRRLPDYFTLDPDTNRPVPVFSVLVPNSGAAAPIGPADVRSQSDHMHDFAFLESDEALPTESASRLTTEPSIATANKPTAATTSPPSTKTSTTTATPTTTNSTATSVDGSFSGATNQTTPTPAKRGIGASSPTATPSVKSNRNRTTTTPPPVFFRQDRRRLNSNGTRPADPGYRTGPGDYRGFYGFYRGYGLPQYRAGSTGEARDVQWSPLFNSSQELNYVPSFKRRPSAFPPPPNGPFGGSSGQQPSDTQTPYSYNFNGNAAETDSYGVANINGHATAGNQGTNGGNGVNRDDHVSNGFNGGNRNSNGASNQNGNRFHGGNYGQNNAGNGYKPFGQSSGANGLNTVAAKGPNGGNYGLNSATSGLNGESYGVNSATSGLNGGSYGLNSATSGLNGGSYGVNSVTSGFSGGSYGVNSAASGFSSGSYGVNRATGGFSGGGSYGLNGGSYGLNGGSYGLNGGSYGLNGGSYGLNGGSYGLNGGSHGLNGGSHGLNSGSYGLNGGSHGLNGGSHGLNGGSHGLNGGSYGLNGGSHGLNGGANEANHYGIGTSFTGLNSGANNFNSGPNFFNAPNGFGDSERVNGYGFDQDSSEPAVEVSGPFAGSGFGGYPVISGFTGNANALDRASNFNGLYAPVPMGTAYSPPVYSTAGGQFLPASFSYGFQQPHIAHFLPARQGGMPTMAIYTQFPMALQGPAPLPSPPIQHHYPMTYPRMPYSPPPVYLGYNPFGTSASIPLYKLQPNQLSQVGSPFSSLGLGLHRKTNSSRPGYTREMASLNGFDDQSVNLNGFYPSSTAAGYLAGDYQPLAPIMAAPLFVVPLANPTGSTRPGGRQPQQPLPSITSDGRIPKTSMPGPDGIPDRELEVYKNNFQMRTKPFRPDADDEDDTPLQVKRPPANEQKRLEQSRDPENRIPRPPHLISRMESNDDADEYPDYREQLMTRDPSYSLQDKRSDSASRKEQATTTNAKQTTEATITAVAEDRMSDESPPIEHQPDTRQTGDPSRSLVVAYFYPKSSSPLRHHNDMTTEDDGFSSTKGRTEISVNKKRPSSTPGRTKSQKKTKGTKKHKSTSSASGPRAVTTLHGVSINDPNLRAYFKIDEESKSDQSRGGINQHTKTPPTELKATVKKSVKGKGKAKSNTQSCTNLFGEPIAGCKSTSGRTRNQQKSKKSKMKTDSAVHYDVMEGGMFRDDDDLDEIHRPFGIEHEPQSPPPFNPHHPPLLHSQPQTPPPHQYFSRPPSSLNFPSPKPNPHFPSPPPNPHFPSPPPNTIPLGQLSPRQLVNLLANQKESARRQQLAVSAPSASQHTGRNNGNFHPAKANAIRWSSPDLRRQPQSSQILEQPPRPERNNRLPATQQQPHNHGQLTLLQHVERPSVYNRRNFHRGLQHQISPHHHPGMLPRIQRWSRDHQAPTFLIKATQ